MWGHWTFCPLVIASAGFCEVIQQRRELIRKWCVLLYRPAMLKHHFTETEDGTLTDGWWAGHYGEQLCTWIWDAEARILRCGDITRPKSLAEFNPEWLTDDELRKRIRREVAESSGFSLHAGIAAKASQRDKLERLARYVARPPVANERLSLTEGGNVRCALKTPYRDGTTHVIFEPEDFIARLAALVPKPRAH